MIENLTSKIIEWRWMVTIATLAAVLLAMMGLRGIYFESDYRIYFPEDNPQRVAHEDMQKMFSKMGVETFLIKPYPMNSLLKEIKKTISKKI